MLEPPLRSITALDKYVFTLEEMYGQQLKEDQDMNSTLPWPLKDRPMTSVKSVVYHPYQRKLLRRVVKNTIRSALKKQRFPMPWGEA
jgi:hypothetical protein